ncbi:uncharacterized protein [Leptinotarsa decemlineata]|uniref:uncharacterized protein n=1 Tax=Leptinotarsa decemlineata TaxID=7539 RepID=UPI003D3084FE
MNIHFVPEEDAEATIGSLKFDNLSSEEFDHCWVACGKYRINEINEAESTSAIMEKLPFYKQPSGFRLIDMDFNIAGHANSEGLLKNWPTTVDKISSFLMDGHIKDRNIKLLLEQLKNGDIEENGIDAAVLWALHGFFVPTNKVVKKDSTGKSRTTEFTIRDSQQSFLYVGKTVQKVEDWIKFLQSKKSSIQPFIFAIGEDITKISEIYTYFDGIKYIFFNIMRAVDICFKIIYIFNLNFPAESIML